MSPYIGQSKVLMDLPEVVAGSLVANRTLAKVPDGASQTQIERIWDRYFGADEEDADVENSTASTDIERPRGNASREDWAAYAQAVGFTEDDLAGKKQGEIRELVEQKEHDQAEKAAQEKDAGGTGTGDGNSDKTE